MSLLPFLRLVVSPPSHPSLGSGTRRLLWAVCPCFSRCAHASAVELPAPLMVLLLVAPLSSGYCLLIYCFAFFLRCLPLCLSPCRVAARPFPPVFPAPPLFPALLSSLPAVRACALPLAGFVPVSLAPGIFPSLTLLGAVFHPGVPPGELGGSRVSAAYRCGGATLPLRSYASFWRFHVSSPSVVFPSVWLPLFMRWAWGSFRALLRSPSLVLRLPPSRVTAMAVVGALVRYSPRVLLCCGSPLVACGWLRRLLFLLS